MFYSKLDQTSSKRLLLPAQSFKPFPQYTDRASWNAISQAVAGMWTQWAEERLDFTWPALPAVRYMDYVRDGNRSRYEQLYFTRRRALCELVIGECVEGRGRFIEQIVNGIWCLCEESYWVIPAHLSISKQSAGSALPDVTDPVIDLFASETGGLLAWTAYLLADRLNEESPMLVQRIRYELNRRLMVPFLERDDFSWMGFTGRKVNNWNPWIISNCLAVFLLQEQEAEPRSRAIEKAAKCLDFFVGVYHADGGCDEGPGYWGRAGASLFDCMELIHLASDGQISFYEEELVRQIGRYIYRAHIDGNYYVNFADGNARIKIAADIVYRYGKRIGDSRMAGLGASAFHGNGVNRDSFGSPMRILGKLFDAGELLAADGAAPYERDVWLADTQIFAVREKGGSSEGLYVAAKGGHNSESHNHNDIGHYIVYYNGRPFLIDAGVENYTSKTFSSRRYEIWTMQSDYHSVPTVGGVQQQAGAAFRATDVSYEASDEGASVSMNIAAAYPKEAGIVAWRRHVGLKRASDGVSLEIGDTFELAAATDDVILNILSLPEPRILADGRIELSNPLGETIALHYDGSRLSAEVEPIVVTDSKLLAVWGEKLHRIKLSMMEPAAEGSFVMRIEAVRS
ncbi:heparinase [Paenibacillus ginsengarvi]|uniref:Heparinase n=1 Tax=Paenibacillus ginsengarvi TaxID=400777 RepID=A0A3B0CFM3_9BACL|nr:heparinase [Paenibacillus ginsengarvi]